MKGILIIGILLLLHGMCSGKKMATKRTRYLTWPSTGEQTGNEYCDVGIVGGGVSGLYMAYEILANAKRHEKVCVFEKESKLGGRILDHHFREAPNIDVGLGAWRISKGQKIMIKLLKELEIKHVDWTLKKPNLYKTRGIASDSEERIKAKAYPAFSRHKKFGKWKDKRLLKYVTNRKNTRKSKDYATFFTYLSNLITPEGAHYLQDKAFHRAEIQDMVNPTHFIEFLKGEMKYSSEYRRPHGGMSAIVKALKKEVESRGGHIYNGTTVKAINEEGTVFAITTSCRKFEALKLVIAVPPTPLRKIEGNVARRIKGTPEFKSILPIPAFKAAAVYKTPWWEKVKIGKTFVKAGQKFVSHDNCLGVSLAHREYGTNSEGVLHTIYTDGHCARQWNNILRLKEKNYIDKEVHRALEAKYNVMIEKPIDTVYQYWDAAWHFQKSDTRYSLKEIRKWAKRPFKNEDIFLVGESYNPQRAWVEGAIVSARYALGEGWGIKRKKSYRKPGKRDILYMPRF